MPDLSFLPPDLIDARLLFAALTVLASGLIRGFSGFGSALINAPVLSLIYGPTVGVPVAALVEVAPAVQLTPGAVRVAQWKSVWAFAIPALILLPLGTVVLTSVPADEMRRGIGAVVLVLALILWSGWRYRGPRGTGPAIFVGLVGGSLAGATGVAGPPVILYLMSSDAPPAVIRANLIGYFTIILFGLTAVFVIKGLITAEVLWITAALLVPFIVGGAVGAKLFPLASEKTFRRIALTALTVSALYVLVA
ncbi:MAG: sulfite exporter TauE/SafE family protein [Alphaproteobacteria bacterium]|nr:sulfite exporter TauE/SafE family protein [Alphaproteobacteria bacterium]